MGETRTAVVAGGGIAGPVAAMALQRAGIEATVYEAHDGPADGVGGALSIAPNGLDALAAVGADGVVRAIGEPITSMVMESGTGRRLGAFAMPAGLPDQQLVWRYELYRVLAGEAARRGVHTVTGARLVGADEDADGVTARFADGTTARADILIGADGIRSTTRTIVDPAAPSPRYAGMLGFGARLAATGAEPTGGAMRLAFGRRAFFGYQVNDDGSGGWFVNLPRRTSMSTAEARRISNAEWLTTLAAAFEGDRLPAIAMIGRTDPADLVVTGALEDIASVPTWSRGRIVLIGDAAHPTSPSSGQGASLAAESAVQLARCLRDLPYAEAFRAYEGLRRERVERIIAMAARTNSDKAAGPLARVARDLLMPVLMRFAKPARFRWQFEHHVDWDAPVTGEPAARTAA